MTDFNKECLNALLNKEKFDEFMRTQLSRTRSTPRKRIDCLSWL